MSALPWILGAACVLTAATVAVVGGFGMPGARANADRKTAEDEAYGRDTLGGDHPDYTDPDEPRIPPLFVHGCDLAAEAQPVHRRVVTYSVAGLAGAQCVCGERWPCPKARVAR